MIWFQYPEVLLLAIPIGIAYTRLSRAKGATAWLRIALLAVLVAALAGPRLDLGGKGIDIIVAADRSRSMPPAAQDNVLALIHDLERNRELLLRCPDRVSRQRNGAPGLELSRRLPIARLHRPSAAAHRL